MHDLQEIREKLMNELCEYGEKGKLDANTLDVIDKLAHSIKNIDKIMETGYSGARYNGRRRDSMGRYVGDYQNRYSMDYNDNYSTNNPYSGYSMNYSMNDNIKQDLKDIMNSADEHTKQKLQRIISQM